MTAPVEGQRILQFGQPTDYGATSKGIVFKTASGTPVQAPVSGVVLFAGEFRSYGDLLIIDGCKVVALVAGILSFDVAAGQIVTAGAPVASVREAPSGEPVVYLEVREGGVPVDPAALMSNR